MGVVESLGVCKAGQTVLARLMESQICTSLLALWFFGRKAQKRDNGLCSP